MPLEFKLSELALKKMLLSSSVPALTEMKMDVVFCKYGCPGSFMLIWNSPQCIRDLHVCSVRNFQASKNFLMQRR